MQTRKPISYHSTVLSNNNTILSYFQVIRPDDLAFSCDF